jgi:FKBP-type peptidyl-prolyl cis-trans isomerase SlyD
MTPAIADGHAVTVHYRLTLDDGPIAEDSLGNDLLVYQQGGGNVGAGNVGVGHERGLTGKVASHQCEIDADPANGHGDYDPTAEQTAPLAQLPSEADIQPGMSYQAEGPRGAVQVWVGKTERGDVTITANHPLAGQRLLYKDQNVDVQETVAQKSPASDSR